MLSSEPRTAPTNEFHCALYYSKHKSDGYQKVLVVATKYLPMLFGNESYLTKLDPWVNPTHGHVCVRRLLEGAPAHDALQVSVELLAGTTSVPDWRRKPGRPRSSWLRGVLKDVQLTAQEAWTTTDYRDDAFCVIGNAGGS